MTLHNRSLSLAKGAFRQLSPALSEPRAIRTFRLILPGAKREKRMERHRKLVSVPKTTEHGQGTMGAHQDAWASIPMLRVVAVELSIANEFVARYHRHHKPEVGHRFSIGAWDMERACLCGVAIVGRPKARMIDYRKVVEVTRLATDGTRNACSLLYGAAARAATWRCAAGDRGG